MTSFVGVPIEETVELNLEYPSVSERYFTKYYFVPKEKKKIENSNGYDILGNGGQNLSADIETTSLNVGIRYTIPSSDESGSAKEKNERLVSSPDNWEHTCVMVHTNKLCLITLSHHHPVLARKKKITKISYDVGRFNRLENQVSGKGKRGAQQLGPQSPICIITCSDSTKYTVLAGIHGKLVEVNERLVSHPHLLSESPNAEGYLALVLPPLRNGDFMRSKLFTEEDYKKLGLYSSSE